MKKVVKSLLVLMLGLSVMTGCSTAAPEEPVQTAGPVTLRVGTWNIDSKAHPDTQKMSEIFLENDLDIIGVQEADVLNARNEVDMIQGLVTENYPYARFAKGRDFADGGFGVGAVSRYEFEEMNSIPIESTGSRATKALQRVLIEKDGKEIAFYNTHLSWENMDLRRRQIAQIVERINADPVEYKVITADFNTDQTYYEFSMFKDNYNVVNGLNGNWIDTFLKEDSAMTVFAIDNILYTKNMKVTDIQSVKTEMSDHALLFAEFELMDAADGAENSDNRALGQNVTVTCPSEGNDVEKINDYDMKTMWISGTEAEQSATLELDRLYAAEQVSVVWGGNKAKTYDLYSSVDNENWTLVTTVEKVSATDIIKLDGTPVKFLRFDFHDKDFDNTGLEINELMVFGDIVKQETVKGNILADGGFETAEEGLPESWTLNINEVEGDTTPESMTAAVDMNTQTEGKASLAITQKGEGNTQKAAVSTTVAVKPLTEYQLRFMHHADGIKSGNFGIGMVQRNAAGEELSTHTVRLNDNLNMSEDWADFRYTFVTNYDAEELTLTFNVGGTEGTVWLDEVSIEEVTPTENILLAAETATLKVGETGGITANVLPQDADDLDLKWVSLDEDVVTVDETGKITANKAGKAYVGLVSTSDLIAESYILITVE